ncbi:MAG: hypothetical protein MJE63_29025 [Proteobacteria bacterium]|nr:hypothetical protein [Pseudomonadota bacterium]
MSDIILIDGDIVNFLPPFGKAIVVPIPGQMKAGGKASVQGKNVCIDGDEKNVSVPGCMYTAPPYTIPGTGTLKIDSLAGDQKAKKMKDGGKPVLLKGKQFNAVFEVMSPATMPPPAGTPDSTPKYNGKGMFVSTNLKWKAS